MALLHEDRLANTVLSGDIGINEMVEVRTKMGSLVSQGEVVSSTPWGIVVKEGTSQNFYTDRLYLFSVVEPELQEIASDLLTDISLDSRVETRLAQMEAGDMQPGGKGSAAGATVSDDDDDDDDEKDKEKKDKEKKDGDDEEEPDDDSEVAAAKPGSAIDPDKLPEDIKKSILSAKQMDEEQLNGVLGEISDAAMKALKRTGVKETEIFGLVNKIQHSAYRVLTGEPAPPPVPKRKKEKK